ncbi:MAG TPA: hypothetical protein VMH78_05825 [Thermoplasmata archaeon]|nr:hypothetical protein [Thermoplasmata archaeon]
MPDQYTLLLEWRRLEGATRGLAKLPFDFIPSTQAYLAESRRVFEAELRENPSGKKGEVARQTFQRASQIARDIVEARMTKILSQAFQASVGGSRDLANALPEERTLFDDLAEALRGHRHAVAPYLDPVAPAPGAARPAPAPAEPARAGPPAGPRRDGATSVLVRVLKDGRPVDIGGETIDLRKEDLLTVPPEVARILVEGKVAERIERGPPAAGA